ncbi:MAG: response regulator [Hyphomicrobiaceae bacterium]|nr:MAG: response regulator [Hyphomicrobiaceae bacterium]
MAARILIIEDDASIVTLLEYNLRSAGFEVVSAGSAEEGELLLKEQHFDLLILDWMLPEMSGIELCGRLSRAGKRNGLPILMLTARGEEADRVRGLKTGADDFVVKPFSVPELMARVSALIRRSAPERVGRTLAHGDISLDREAHLVKRASREILLGPTEFRLLEAFLESPGRVLSRGQLIDRVWGGAAEIDERTIDVHVGRLRKALIRGNEGDPIRTIRGAGYAIGGGQN